MTTAPAPSASGRPAAAAAPPRPRTPADDVGAAPAVPPSPSGPARPGAAGRRPRRHDGRGALLPVVTGALVGLLCAVAVVAVGMAAPEAAPLTASFVVAVTGLVGAAVVLARRGPVRGRSARRWFAASAAAWCGGELVSAFVVVLATGPPPRPNLGDAISICAGPLALVGVLRLPRPAGRVGALRTLGVDAVVLALGAAVAVWMGFFPSGAGEAPGLVVFCVLVVVLYLVIGSLIAQVAMVGRDLGVAVLLVGLAALAVGDLAVTRELLAGAALWSWPLAATQCLAWPVILGGVDAIARRRPLTARSGRTDEGESSATVMTTAAVYVAWLGALAALPRNGGGTVAVVLGLLAVGSAGLREVLRLRARLRAVRRLAEEARHDALTGLGNARALTGRLAGLLDDGSPASVVLLDVDDFAALDERLGRTASDELLVRLAATLAARFGDDRTHRLGADDLAILCPTGPAEAEAVAEEARALLVAAAGPALRLTARAGVAGVDALPAATAATAPTTAAQLLAEATTAVTAAGRAGGDRTALFRGEVAERVRRRALVEHRLRQAVTADALSVQLQPLVHLVDGRLKGFEVLSRWTDEVLGRVGPDEFVPVAEAAGLVPAVGRAALRRGLAALVAAGGPARGLTLSVNASPLELRDPGYPDVVLAELAAAGVAPGLLVVEVTEGLLVTEDDPALDVLRALREGGCRVALDDVGAGYASMTYLARLPVDVVKVDRSLVAGVGTPRTGRVLEALVQLSCSLGLVVLVEGVEEEHQVAPLIATGATLGQGWLWSRALPVDELPALVAADAAAHPGPARAVGAVGAVGGPA